MQSSSSGLSFKQSLAGASPATETISNSECRIVGAFLVIRRAEFVIRNSPRSQGVRESARLPAKEKVRGANPRESAILRDGFAFQDCGVTAASPPVKRTVRVQIPAS